MPVQQEWLLELAHEKEHSNGLFGSPAVEKAPPQACEVLHQHPLCFYPLVPSVHLM